jgi:hypothetical protein
MYNSSGTAMQMAAPAAITASDMVSPCFLRTSNLEALVAARDQRTTGPIPPGSASALCRWCGRDRREGLVLAGRVGLGQAHGDDGQITVVHG